MGSYYKLFKWLLIERKALSQIYMLAALQGLMYLGITLGIQTIITYTMAGEFSASLILLCALTVLAVVFVGLFQLWQMRISETVNQKIFASLSSKISNYLAKKEGEHKAETESTINQFFEIVSLQKGVNKILLDFSFAVISIIIGLLVLPAYNSWFMVFSMVMSLVFFLVLRFYGRKATQSSLNTSKQKYKLIDWFQKSIKSNKSSSDITSTSNYIINNYVDYRTKHYINLEVQYKAILIFKVIFVAVLLLVGAFLVQVGQLNIGQFVAAEIIIILVINSVEKLVTSLDTCYDVITAITKIEELIPNFHEQEDSSLQLDAVRKIYKHSYSKKIKVLLYSLLAVAFLVLFAPWTQTIDCEGKVTTLNPENRPQTINSRISGRIEKWFVNEGDFVRKNDTIAFLSEIKEDYIDPKLIQRTEEQVSNKESSIISYEQKINSINTQVDAINTALKLKTEQARNKLQQVRQKILSDSAEVVAVINNLKVSEDQFKRFEELLTKGIISKTDLENRKVKLQDALAKKISAENKLLNTKNDYLNAEIELNSIQQEYNEKLMKAESDKFSALSMMYDAEATLAKLQNQVTNYSIRSGFYFVLAPQDGYITKTFSQGVGEIIKEGSALCSIVPKNRERSVEIYIDPIDLPLVSTGQNVQLTFDGWPAFVFSGWPGVSFGTYSAEIVAIDKNISDNGKFRALAKSKDDSWPTAIQIGSGVKGFALLKNVPVFYELWRKANGFPPEFYAQPENQQSKKNKDGKKDN